MRKSILAACLAALVFGVGCSTTAAVPATKVNTVSDSTADLKAECLTTAQYLSVEIDRISASADAINPYVKGDVTKLVSDTRSYISKARSTVAKCSEFLSASQIASYNASTDALEDAVAALPY